MPPNVNQVTRREFVNLGDQIPGGDAPALVKRLEKGIGGGDVGGSGVVVVHHVDFHPCAVALNLNGAMVFSRPRGHRHRMPRLTGVGGRQDVVWRDRNAVVIGTGELKIVVVHAPGGNPENFTGKKTGDVERDVVIVGGVVNLHMEAADLRRVADRQPDETPDKGDEHHNENSQNDGPGLFHLISLLPSTTYAPPREKFPGDGFMIIFPRMWHRNWGYCALLTVFCAAICTANALTGPPAKEGKIAGHALPGTVVYLADSVVIPAAGSLPPRRATLRLSLAGGKVTPRISATPANSLLILSSADVTVSDVVVYYGVSDLAFAHKFVDAGDRYEFLLARPGLMLVTNENRPGEQGWIYVTPHRSLAVVGADGEYSLGPLRAGRHRITAWNEKEGTRDATVEVSGGKTVTLNFPP